MNTAARTMPAIQAAEYRESTGDTRRRRMQRDQPRRGESLRLAHDDSERIEEQPRGDQRRYRQPVEDFGENGRLDLTPSGRSAPFFVSVPGIVFEDLIVLGFSTHEGDGAHAGSVRAYSAITGDLVWQFNSLPRPEEVGSETWADGALERAGGANNWTGMALDVERELLFVPTGSATPDFYGASRAGDNLFANCLAEGGDRLPVPSTSRSACRRTTESTRPALP